MGTSTKAIVPSGTTIENIASVLSDHYHEVSVRKTGNDDFFHVLFNIGPDQRMMSCFFNDYAESDYGIPGVILSLGFDPGAVKVLRYLCNHYGGYLNENDSNEGEFIPIQMEKFTSSKSLTDLDRFKNKVCAEFGHKKLNTFLIMADEYLKITE